MFYERLLQNLVFMQAFYKHQKFMLNKDDWVSLFERFCLHSCFHHKLCNHCIFWVLGEKPPEQKPSGEKPPPKKKEKT